MFTWFVILVIVLFSMAGVADGVHDDRMIHAPFSSQLDQKEGES